MALREKATAKVAQLRATLAFIQLQITLAGDTALALSEDVFGSLRNPDIKFRAANRAQGQIVNSLVVIGATLIIGIVVYSRIETSTPDPSNSQLNSTQQSVTDTVADSFDLGALLPLVIIAGAVLFYVRGFGNSGGGGR